MLSRRAASGKHAQAWGCMRTGGYAAEAMPPNRSIPRNRVRNRSGVTIRYGVPGIRNCVQEGRLSTTQRGTCAKATDPRME